MELSSLQLDALKEVGTIGAGNAATVLSTLLGRRIPMTVPQARLLPLTEVVDALGGAEKEVVGICTAVSGDAKASILFLLPLERARHLVHLLLHQEEGEGGAFSDMEQSALGEVTNILTGAYLQALSEMTHLQFHPTVPAFAHDMAGALVDSILSEIGQVADYALLIDTDFVTDDEGEGVRGHFFLVPDPDSLPVILQALGVKEGCNQKER